MNECTSEVNVFLTYFCSFAQSMRDEINSALTPYSGRRTIQEEFL